MGEVILNVELASEIDDIINANDCDPSKLIGILLEVQDIIPSHYIPAEVAAYVSDKLNIPLSRVYDVITFYAALSLEPRAKYVIQVCDSVACRVVGNNGLKEALEAAVGVSIGQKTDDGRFALECVPCFGACDVAPAIRLNGKVYGGLTSAEKIEEIVAGCR